MPLTMKWYLRLHEEVPHARTKAKEWRRVAEPMITLGKNPSLANRRLAYDRLRDRDIVANLFGDHGKRYAKRMPHLATVRDGSDGTFGPGYWGCLAVACEVDQRRVIPLHQRLWSAEAPDFVSENAQLLEIIDTIRGPTAGRVW